MAAPSLHELTIIIDGAMKAATVLEYSTLAYLFAMASLEASLLIEKGEDDKSRLPLAS